MKWHESRATLDADESWLRLYMPFPCMFAELRGSASALKALGSVACKSLANFRPRTCEIFGTSSKGQFLTGKHGSKSRFQSENIDLKPNNRVLRKLNDSYYTIPSLDIMRDVRTNQEVDWKKLGMIHFMSPDVILCPDESHSMVRREPQEFLTTITQQSLHENCYRGTGKDPKLGVTVSTWFHKRVACRELKMWWRGILIDEFAV